MNNPQIPSQIIKEINFPNFINTLGIIPTSYKDSMTYYECLAWLCKYLEETVIPTVNENGKAVEELQTLYVELKNYVDNYFTNLDVQQKINNKLDEMVNDGTFAKIINENIFDELNTKVLNLQTDVSGLQTNVSGLQTNVSNITNKQFAIIGDSWTATDTDSINARGGADTWVTEFQNITNINCINMAEGGAGFVKKGLVNHRNFNEQLIAIHENNNIDDNLIDKIIVYGGINDFIANNTQEQIIEGCTALINTWKTYFTKAKLYIFYFNNGIASTYNLTQTKLDTLANILQFLSNNNVNAFQCVTWLMDNDQLFYNPVHPNENGIKRICDFMLQSLYGGTGILVNYKMTAFYLKSKDGTFNFTDDDYNTNTFNLVFNPLTGYCYGVANFVLRKYNSIAPNFSAQYIIETDAPAYLLRTSHLAPLNYGTLENQARSTNMYAFVSRSGSKTLIGFDFSNNATTNNKINFIATSFNINVLT